ncbi:MAG: T9SS type A sorting domain-containing protein [Bacteroidales bacterium]|nr:T9SS type A sorting domain-containing protein [Bacteroidales bacterium]
MPVTVTIYPNPTSESVKIKFETAVDRLIDIQIIDGQGKLIKTDRIEESVIEKTINLYDLPCGTYYLRLLKGNVANVYKIVKL